MLTVVIQAGGESQRMGMNKALAPFLGQPLIARVVKRICSLGDEILITTNQMEGFEFLDLPLIADILPGMGALGGLYTALQAAHFPYVAVVACDMPFASRELLEFQRDLLVREGADVVLPSTVQGYEPLHAVYRKETCLPAVEAALRQGQKRMVSWFPQVNVRTLTDDELARFDPFLTAFMNVNTPDELIQAEIAARTETD